MNLKPAWTIQTAKSCLTHRKNGTCCRIVADPSFGTKHFFLFLFCWVLLLWMDAFSFYQTFFSMEGMSCVWMHDVGSAWKAFRRHWVWGAEAQQIASGLEWTLQQQRVVVVVVRSHWEGGGGQGASKKQKQRGKCGSEAVENKPRKTRVLRCGAQCPLPSISYLSCCHAKIFW